MATRKQRLGAFLQSYVQDRMIRKRQEEAQKAQMEREQAGNDTQVLLQELRMLQSMPELGPKLKASGRTHVGATPIDVFTPSEADVAGGVSKRIADVSDLTKLQTDEDLHSAVHEVGRSAHTPYETLDLSPYTKQRDARRSAIVGGMAPIRVDGAVSQDGKSRGTRFLSADPTKLVGEGDIQTEYTGEQEGARKGASELAHLGTPGLTEKKAEEKNQYEALIFPDEFKRQQKLANMQAAIDIDKAKKIAAARGDTAGVASAEEAAGLVKDLEQIIGMAEVVNGSYPAGGMDVASGLKNAAGKLPWIGPAFEQLLNTGMSAVDSGVRGPAIPALVNNLEARRYQAALKAIRAAGDPRPSNQDVQGILPMIPGAYESADSTAMKSKALRDGIMFLPLLQAKYPDLKGKALLDRAFEEARTKSVQQSQFDAKRGTSNQPTQPTNPAQVPTKPKRYKVNPDGTMVEIKQ